MNYNNIKKLSKLTNPNEPTNEELEEIEEHLDDYIDDPDGDPLTIVSIPSIDAPNLATAFGGSLELGERGEYTYSPPPFETSTDFLLFKADDGTAQSAMAFGSLSVDAEARDSWRDRMIPPTAFDDATILEEDNTQEISFNAFDPFFSIDLTDGLTKVCSYFSEKPKEWLNGSAANERKTKIHKEAKDKYPTWSKEVIIEYVDEIWDEEQKNQVIDWSVMCYERYCI